MGTTLNGHTVFGMLIYLYSEYSIAKLCELHFQLSFVLNFLIQLEEHKCVKTGDQEGNSRCVKFLVMLDCDSHSQFLSSTPVEQKVSGAQQVAQIYHWFILHVLVSMST
jgi:hypothetical protein